VIACSSFMVDEVVSAFGLPRDKVDEVPNGVNADDFAPQVDEPRGAHGHPLVVSWGRVQYEKGFHTVVEAMARLRHRVPGIRAVIAGRGGYLAELQHHAVFHGVSDIVDFPGFVPDHELKRLLHQASCAVIPSLYEPFGIVALEAMAAKAPVVATRTGGLAEVLEGTNAGMLVPPGDADAMASAIERVCVDPQLAYRCQAAGDALVRTTYSWDSVARATVPVYERAMTSERTGAPA
jgi:glycogen synthase